MSDWEPPESAYPGGKPKKRGRPRKVRHNDEKDFVFEVPESAIIGGGPSRTVLNEYPQIVSERPSDRPAAPYVPHSSAHIEKRSREEERSRVPHHITYNLKKTHRFVVPASAYLGDKKIPGRRRRSAVDEVPRRITEMRPKSYWKPPKEALVGPWIRPPPGSRVSRPKDRGTPDWSYRERKPSQDVDPATCVGVYRNCLGLNVELLRKRLTYHPDTGILTWKRRSGWGGAATGQVSMRQVISIDRKQRNIFGVIYLIHLGHLPDGPVPLRDHDPTNHRWDNIKGITHEEMEARRVADENMRALRLSVPATDKREGPRPMRLKRLRKLQGKTLPVERVPKQPSETPEE